jgi:hypothetical protein
VLSDADVVEQDVREYRQRRREREVRVRRDLEERQDREDVHHQDEHEQRGQVAREPQAIVADHLRGDAVAAEPINRFSNPLQTAGHDLRFPVRDQEENDDRRGGDP